VPLLCFVSDSVALAVTYVAVSRTIAGIAGLVPTILIGGFAFAGTFTDVTLLATVTGIAGNLFLHSSFGMRRSAIATRRIRATACIGTAIERVALAGRGAAVHSHLQGLVEHIENL